MRRLKKVSRLLKIARDWRWVVFYAQRLIKDPIWRSRAASAIARLRPAPLTESDALRQMGADLKAQGGLLQLGRLLSHEQCSELLAFLEQRPVFDDYRPGTAPFLPLSGARDPASHVAYHDPNDVVGSPYLLELANDPRLLSIAEAHLGCRPTIGYLAAWWSYPTLVGAQQAELFHRDVDDFSFLKLFVYLTDVDEKTGPHVYVVGSSAMKTLRAIRRYSDDEVNDAVGKDAIKVITAPAGYGFMEDTTGLHRGEPLKSGRRVVFQAVYTLRPLPYAPKAPILSRTVAEARVGVALDKYVNRVYLH